MCSPSMQLPSRVQSLPKIQRHRKRNACLACRQQRRRCDESQSRCIACRSQGIHCAWPNGRALASAIHISPQCRDTGTAFNNGRDRTVLSAPTYQISFLSTLPPLFLTSESTRILRYYLRITARQLVPLSTSDNPLITRVLPAAKANNTLLHAVLAAAGAHLAYNVPNSASIETATYQHYLYAIWGVRKTIASKDLDKPSYQYLLIILTLSLSL